MCHHALSTTGLARLNRLGDEGGKLLLEGVLENSSLTQLNLSCNALEMDSVQVGDACSFFRCRGAVLACSVGRQTNPATR